MIKNNKTNLGWFLIDFKFFTEFLSKNKCSDEVRQFMEKAGADNDLMLLYLRARKNRPEHAWETVSKKKLVN